MNTRLGPGLAALGCSLALLGGEARADSHAICSPVYDATVQGPPDPDLTGEIQELKEKGIDARVQILSPNNEYGIEYPEDVESLQNDIERRCGTYYSDHRIDVTIDPISLHYSVDESGYGAAGESDKLLVKDSFQKQFEKDIKDGSTPYQEDVTHFLQKVNGDQSFVEWIKDGDNLPWIIGGFGLIALAGVGVAMSRSGGGGPRGGGGGGYKSSGNDVSYVLIYIDSSVGGYSGGYSGGDAGGSFGGDSGAGSFSG
jgi:hypothetical protein